MLWNYLKAAYRNLKKTRLFSLINILGLSVGMAACLLILHYVNFERSFDRFQPDNDRIYRLRYERISENGEAVRFASCAPPAADQIRGRYPEIEAIGRIFHYRAVAAHEDIKFMEERMYFAEAEFFEVLKFDFITGDPQSLTDPNRAFISEVVARKYFGDQDPIGKTITTDGQTDYEIVGLFREPAANSHLKFDILLSFPNVVSWFGPDVMEAWGHTGFYTYLRVKPGTDPAVLEQKFVDLVQEQFGEALEQYKMEMLLPLQPLTDIHLTSHYMQEYEINGDADTVRFLSIIAVLIILIAWINYVNLSTARSLTRAREVGLRKVVGATRSQLVIQFFTEIGLINIAALLAAFGLIEILLPVLQNLTGTPIGFSIWTQNWFWPTCLGLFLVGILLSGLYPVMALSAFRPSRVLRGKLGGGGGFNLRKILVVAQFALSLALVTGTLAVYQQIIFMKKQDLGFNLEQNLVIKAPRVRDDAFQEKVNSFKETILTETDVLAASVSTEVPGRQIHWDAGGIFRQGGDISDSKNYQIMGIDYDFVEVFDLTLIEGRNFSRDFATDEEGLLMNETAVSWMGFESPAEAVGDQVSYWGQPFNIIGVVKDYHQQSVKAAYEPTLFRLMPYGRGKQAVFSVKINSSDMPATMKRLESTFKDFFPGNPFDYFFLDDYFNQQYKAEEQFAQVLGFFAFLAIFVTSLGIFGLSSFMAVQRTKEIGIRKVLGATISRILLLLTKDFLVLLVIAFVITVPVMFFGVDRWLADFAVRMNPGALLFLLPLVTVLVISLLTVGAHVIKAATANPVKSLRYE